MYAVIQRDKTGLFCWMREKYEKSAYATGVVEIYRGPLRDLGKRVKDFINENSGEDVKLMSPAEIGDRLEELKGLEDISF